MASKKYTAKTDPKEPVIFTVKYLKSLRPETKKQQIMDASYPGLGVIVTPLGKRGKNTPTIRFVYRYTSPVTGKRDIVTIGRFLEKREEGKTRGDSGPATLAEARAERARLEAMILQGEDPNRSDVPTDTIKAVAVKFLEAKKGLAFQTIKAYTSALNSKILPALGERRITDIERDEVIRLLDSVYASSGFEMMRQTKKTLSSMFSYAMDRLGIPGLKHDITKGIRLTQWSEAEKRKPKPKKVWLRADEIRLFWEYLDRQTGTLNDSYIRLWKLILITGCRPIEGVGMKWSDIGSHDLVDIHDLEKIDKARLWLRPVELMKSSEPHLTYLTDLAMEIIEPLRANPKDLVLWYADTLSDKQMVSRRKYGGQLLKMTHGIFNKSEAQDKRRIEQIEGVRKFTQHDLRRTVSTQMGNLGIDPSHISKVLAHSSREGEAAVTRKHYNFAEYIHQKIDALTKWEVKLRSILNI